MFGFGENKVENTEENSSTPWDSKIGEALLNARKGQHKASAGTQKGTEKGKDKNSWSDLPNKAKDQIAKLFEPSSWEPIVKAPFAVMQALTGRKAWELEQKEVDSLAIPTSMAAEYFTITDPKWVAFGMCAVAWSSIVCEKLIKSAQEARAEELLRPKPDIQPKGNHGNP